MTNKTMVMIMLIAATVIVPITGTTVFANSYDHEAILESPYVKSNGNMHTTIKNVDGFVMVGHGVITDGDDDEAVYQEAYSNKIGNIVENHYDQNNQEFGCDCAFVELDSGRSVANEVIYDGLLLTINGYTDRGDQTEGHYVLKSGITTDHTWGQIISLDNMDSDWVYADYDSAIGDSGGPVGKVSSSNINIYGIHRGVSPDESYSAYVPYDTIKSYLDLD